MSEDDKQPMISENKNIIISVNGEIYNFLKLTKENDIENLKEILLEVALDIKSEKIKSRENHAKALEVFAL